MASFEMLMSTVRLCAQTASSAELPPRYPHKKARAAREEIKVAITVLYELDARIAAAIGDDREGPSPQRG
jgi:hypothetical protein